MNPLRLLRAVAQWVRYHVERWRIWREIRRKTQSSTFESLDTDR